MLRHGEQALVESFATSCLEDNKIALSVLFDLGSLAAQSLHRSNVGEGFLCHYIHLAFYRLDLPLQLAHPAIVVDREQGQRDDATEGDRCQNRADYHQHHNAGDVVDG